MISGIFSSKITFFDIYNYFFFYIYIMFVETSAYVMSFIYKSNVKIDSSIF